MHHFQTEMVAVQIPINHAAFKAVMIHRNDNCNLSFVTCVAKERIRDYFIVWP